MYLIFKHNVQKSNIAMSYGKYLKTDHIFGYETT